MNIGVKHNPQDICKICPNKFKHLTDECQYHLQEIKITIEDNYITVAKVTCMGYFASYKTILQNIFDLDRKTLLSSEINHTASSFYTSGYGYYVKDM